MADPVLRSRAGARHIEVLGTCPAGDRLIAERGYEAYTAGHDSCNLLVVGPTLAVVSTTMVITSLKTFDIVYTLTSGNFNTDTIANLMIKQMFTIGDFGRASAVAVVLLIAIIPIMAFNIRQFKAQESVR